MSAETGPAASNTPAADLLTVLVVALETPEVPGRLTFEEVPRSVTVGEFRLRIRQRLVSRPDVQRLRLIHNGRLLSQDAMTLGQVLGNVAGQQQRAITLHLALRPGPDSSQTPGQPAPAAQAPVSTFEPSGIGQANRPAEAGQTQAGRPPETPQFIPPINAPLLGGHNAAALHNAAVARAMAAHQEALRLTRQYRTQNAAQVGSIDQEGQASPTSLASQTAVHGSPAPSGPSHQGPQSEQSRRGTQPTRTQGNEQAGATAAAAPVPAAAVEQDQAANALQQILIQQIGVVNNMIQQLAQAGIAVNQAAGPGVQGPGQGQLQQQQQRQAFPTRLSPRAMGPVPAGLAAGATGQRAFPIQDFQRHLNEQHRARQQAANAAEGQANGINSGAQQAHLAHLAQAQQAQRTDLTPQQAQQSQQAQQARQQNIGAASNSGGGQFSMRPGQMAQVPVIAPGQTPMQSFVARVAAARGSSVSTGLQVTAPGSSLQHLSGEYDSIYLLTSPEGNQAILLSPPVVRRGPTDVAAVLAQNTNIAAGGAGGQMHVPHPINAMGVPAAAVGAAAGAGAVRGNAGRNGNEVGPQPMGFQDLLGILLPFGGHLWLLARLVFFTIILTWGATWRRTILVYLGVILIFMSQTGLLRPFQAMAEQAWVPVRRHIEDLVRDIDGDRPAQGAAGEPPDPRQVAERLLRQQREQSVLRRAERSVALFVASFVPGVGEAQVAAREQAARNRRQQLEAQEAARQQREREEQEAAAAAAAPTGEAGAESEEGERSKRSEDEAGGESQAGVQPGRISPVGDAVAASSAEPSTESRDGLRQRQPMVEEGSDDDDA